MLAVAAMVLPVVVMPKVSVAVAAGVAAEVAVTAVATAVVVAADTELGRGRATGQAAAVPRGADG